MDRSLTTVVPQCALSHALNWYCVRMDMTAAIVTLIVAFIAATPPLVATVASNRKTRNENATQHGASKAALEELGDRVAQVHGIVKGVGTHISSVDDKVSHLGERVAVVEQATFGSDHVTEILTHQMEKMHAHQTRYADEERDLNSDYNL